MKSASDVKVCLKPVLLVTYLIGCDFVGYFMICPILWRQKYRRQGVNARENFFTNDFFGGL